MDNGQEIEVTDEEVLKQLNNSGSVERKEEVEVSDKDVLNQLSPSHLSKFLSGAANLGSGVVQGAANIGHGIGDLETRLINSLIGSRLSSPKPDVYGAVGSERTGLAQAGEFGGELAAGGALTAAAAPFMGVPAAMGAASFVSDPGEVSDRTKSAAVGYGLGKGGEMIGRGVNYARKHASTKKLGQAIDELSKKTGEKTSELFDKAYSGTGAVKPVINSNTIKIIQDLKGKSGSREVMDSVKNFSKDPSLSRLHDVRKDVQKGVRNLQSKQAKSGLGGRDSDMFKTLKELEGSISSDLEKSFKSISPEKHGQFKEAMTHFKEKELPLRKYKSIRDYLGEERSISKGLRRDIMKDEKSANYLRKELGMSRPAMKIMGSPNKGVDIKTIASLDMLKRLLRQ